MGHAAISFDELKEGASMIEDIDLTKLSPHEAMQLMEYKRQVMGHLKMIWAIARQVQIERPMAPVRIGAFLSH